MDTSLQKLLNLFLDSNVLFSGIASKKGASHEILKLGIANKTKIITLDYVLDEVRLNLSQKMPQRLADFEQILKLVEPIVCPEPSSTKIVEALKIISDPKDAPILAAVIDIKPDYLVTLDKKHFIESPSIAKKSNIKIVTPGDFLKIWRQKQN